MHICHVAHNYYPGVSLAAMYEFTQEEARQGCKVSAIVLGREPQAEMGGDVNGVTVYRFPSASMSAGSMHKFKFIRQASNL